MAGLERSVDDLIHELSEKYGHMYEISPKHSQNMKVMSSARLPPVTPFDNLSDSHTFSQPGPVLSTQPPSSPAPPAIPPFAFTPFHSVSTSAPDLFAHESTFPSRVLPTPAAPFLFGRKALQPLYSRSFRVMFFVFGWTVLRNFWSVFI